ncbi:IPT/TIG domain-containing protein [Cupriavidus basilensis]|nr:IPT/TIG domain-containing protein [Cupriavidus basilensis]
MTRLLFRSLCDTFLAFAMMVLGVFAGGSLVWGAAYNFAYDEVGRLTGVVDEAGNTAIYAYDAAGNITAIGRGSAAVSVMSFSPRSGPTGTTVTISGAGFSATASQNTVQFNGVAAAISSASTNQLVIQVPAAATTGPISVTSPSGSAVSSNAFTVAQGGAPVISGFTPTIGTPGTAVTINGSNFQTTLNQNNLTFNTRLALVSAATASALTTAVAASATSGRLALTTPFGQAISSQDFFVPPSPRTATDVELTGRMTIGSSQTVSITTAGKVGLILFDGVAGQRVSLQVTGSNFGMCAGGGVQIIKPDGSSSTSAALCNGNFLDPVTMPVTFSGTAGQRVSLQTSQNTVGCHTLAILKPDGSQLFSSGFCGTAYVDTQVLPLTGTYAITLDPWDVATGSLTFTLYDVPADATATITIGGSSVTLTTAVPGQNGNLTFSGTAGQHMSLSTSGNTIGCYTLAILKPDSATLTSTGTCGTPTVDQPSLPTTGTYTIALDPWGNSIGSLTFTLSP